MLRVFFVPALIFAIGLFGMLAKAAWFTFKRRNNPTYPDHERLDDGALAFEHAHGRLLHIPLKNPENAYLIEMFRPKTDSSDQTAKMRHELQE